MKLLAKAAIVLTALALPLSAQAQNSLGGTSSTSANASLANDGRMVRSVTLEDMKALVVSEGHTLSRAEFSSSSGAPFVVATDGETGLVFVMFGTACGGGTDPDCNGINMMATWGATPGNSVAADINALNESKAAVSVFKSGDSVGVSRYVILDGGMNMENIKWNMRVFLSITDELSPNFLK